MTARCKWGPKPAQTITPPPRAYQWQHAALSTWHVNVFKRNKQNVSMFRYSPQWPVMIFKEKNRLKDNKHWEHEIFFILPAQQKDVEFSYKISLRFKNKSKQRSKITCCLSLCFRAFPSEHESISIHLCHFLSLRSSEKPVFLLPISLMCLLPWNQTDLNSPDVPLNTALRCLCSRSLRMACFPYIHNSFVVSQQQIWNANPGILSRPFYLLD